MATDAELLTALWDLVWAGEVTNDTLAPLRAVIGGAKAKAGGRGPPGTRPATPGRLNRIGPPAGAGRWSLVAHCSPRPTPTAAAHAAATQLLERHGVLTREAVQAEGVVGGFSSVYGVLKVLEERGQARRGYFVDGLGRRPVHVAGRRRPPAQRPRGARPRRQRAAGAGRHRPGPALREHLAWPDSAGRPARSAGALVVLHQGRCLAWIDPRSHHLVTFPATRVDDVWADALAALVAPVACAASRCARSTATPIDQTSDVIETLRRVGFVDGYRGLTLRT